MSVWDDLIQKLAFLDIEQQERVLAFIKQIDSGQDVNRIIVYVTISALRTNITVMTKYTYMLNRNRKFESFSPRPEGEGLGVRVKTTLHSNLSLRICNNSRHFKGTLGLIDTIVEYMQSKSDYAISRDFATRVLRMIGLSPLSEYDSNQLILGLKVTRGGIKLMS